MDPLVYLLALTVLFLIGEPLVNILAKRIRARRKPEQETDADE